MSNEQPESSVNQRWEARARVEYPLHYLIWLREHKLLEEKLEMMDSDQDFDSQVILLIFPTKKIPVLINSLQKCSI